MSLPNRLNLGLGANPNAGPASILNVARIGQLTSDRAIGDHCHDIWNVPPVTVAEQGL